MGIENDPGGEYYRRWLKKDEDAFGEIVRLYRKKMILFVNRYLDNPSLSEAVVADAFCELIVHKSRYHFRVSLKTYLFAIAKHKALNLLREKRHESNEPLAEDLADLWDMESELIGNEQKKALHRALSTLPKPMGEAVYLYYFEQMTYAECARVMRLPVKKVDNLLYGAKQKLRSILEKEGWR